MLPEVEKYLTTVEKVEETFRNDRAEIRRNRNNMSADKYYASLDAVQNTWRKATNDAWDELKKSDNKLVAWIANNSGISDGYRGHASLILRELPASLDTLDNVARKNNWCPVWNDFRAEALADGAIEIDYDLQVSLNGGPWQNFFDIRLPGNEYFVKKDANDLFSMGISFLQFDTGTTNVKIQMKPTS